MEENTKNMLAGLPYRPDTEELRAISTKAHRLSRDYNQTADEDKEVRKAIIDNLFPEHGEGVYLQGPIEVDYGKFTKLGKNFYANFNLTILDTLCKWGHTIFVLLYLAYFTCFQGSSVL